MFEAEKLLELIRAHPEGIGEHELLKQLYAQSSMDKPSLQDPLVLFQQHFSLFHLLYTLRDELYRHQLGHLEIGALNIQWLPYREQAAGQELRDHDPLREYYLDLNNLKETDREGVETLLNGFWDRFESDSGKQQALDLLGLEEPITLTEIKRRYRELLSDAHPDRGGCHETTQQLNEAMALLRRCYS